MLQFHTTFFRHKTGQICRTRTYAHGYKIEITSWPHGEIFSYIEYWASDPTQKKTHVGYQDPHFTTGSFNQRLIDMTPGHHVFNTDTTLTYTDRTVTLGHNGTTATYDSTTIIHPKKSSFTYSHDTNLYFTGSTLVTGKFENGTKFSYRPNTPITFPAGTTVTYDAARNAVLADQTIISYANDTTVTYSISPETAITYHAGSTIITFDNLQMKFLQDDIDMWIDAWRAWQRQEQAYFANGQLAHSTTYFKPEYSNDVSKHKDIESAFRSDGTRVLWFEYDNNRQNTLSWENYNWPNNQVKYSRLNNNAPVCYNMAGSVETCTPSHSIPQW